MDYATLFKTIHGTIHNYASRLLTTKSYCTTWFVLKIHFQIWC